MKTCNQLSFFLFDRLTILLTPFRGSLKNPYNLPCSGKPTKDIVHCIRFPTGMTILYDVNSFCLAYFISKHT